MLALVLAGAVRAATPAVATLPDGVKRVVVLGDGITYAGGYVTAIDVYFATRHPGRAIEVLNVGLASETVSGLSEDGHAGGKFPRPDLHERLGRVLAQTKPDLVLACYGMNDGIYLPLAEERFARFREGIVRLRTAVAGAGARMVHVTPPAYDDERGGKPGYGAVLARYAAWLLEQRKAAGWDVIDVNGPMQTFLAERRAADATFHLAKDGIHPGEQGHWLMARAILRHWGARDLESTGSVAEMVAGHARGADVVTLVMRRQSLWRDAWLTATGHTRPGVKAGLPLAEAKERAAEIERALAKLRE
jgi:lysophospholipase L1-like esterase